MTNNNQGPQLRVYPIRSDEIDFIGQALDNIPARFSQIEPIVVVLREVAKRTPVEIKKTPKNTPPSETTETPADSES